MNSFEIREDENGIGKVLILKESWSDAVGVYMRNNSISALRLTDSFGFKIHDLSFLSELLPKLKTIDVEACNRVGG